MTEPVANAVFLRSRAGKEEELVQRPNGHLSPGPVIPLAGSKERNFPWNIRPFIARQR
jgi:hypothetical protein